MLVLKNAILPPLKEVLFLAKLNGKQSRMRTRFLALVEEQLKQVEKERGVLIEMYAERDADGNLIEKTTNEGKVVYNVANEQIKDFQKDVAELLEENFLLKEDVVTQDMLDTVKQALADFDGELAGAAAVAYDEICTAFGI